MEEQYIPRQLWEVWPGKNRFFCKGRLMLGPRSDQRYFISSLIILTVIPIIFFVFLSGYLVLEGYYMMTAIDLILYICTIFFFFKTSLTEPGIIPRRSVLQVLGQRIDQENFKMCTTCFIYKSKRTHHCRECDNCVEIFDHHCRFLNNCIGARNYRYFFIFILFLSLFCILTIVICFQFIFFDFGEKGYGKRTFVGNEVFNLSLSVILAVVCTLLGIFPTLLCLQHLVMCFTGQTTKERVYGQQDQQGNKCVFKCKRKNSRFDLRRVLNEQEFFKIKNGTIETIEIEMDSFSFGK